ncbi:MAG: outer membrane protein assembly factor BamD [Archangium sp.]|nr:outer membrane protein assembly factor BamD [Archangium sp.]
MTPFVLVAVLAQPLLNPPSLTVDKKSHEQALYAALVSYYSSLQPGNVERLNTFQTTDARQALKLLGAEFVKRYPKSEHALEVKFNIARATYEDGDFAQAATLLKTFAMANPKHPDAVVAGELALDALDQIRDCAGVNALGTAFAKEDQFPADFTARARRIADAAANGDCNIRAWVETPGAEDLLDAVLKTADEKKGTPGGEKALMNAISITSDRQDSSKRDELVERLLREYPRSESAASVLQVTANDAIATARFNDASKNYEELGARFNDSVGVEALLNAARIKKALGDTNGAVKNFEAAATNAGARKGEVLVALAQTLLKTEPQRARAIAEQALKLDRTDAAAAAVLAEVMAADLSTKPEAMVALLTPVTNGPRASGEDTAKALWFLGDVLFRRFKAMPTMPLNEKADAMNQTQAIFQQAAEMGSAEWTVASMWRVGGGLNHLADSLEVLGAPEVKATVTQLRAQAATIFERCVSRSQQLGVYSVASIGCRTRSDSAASPLRSLPAMKPVNVEELQKTVLTKRDAASFEALGVAYLGAWRVKQAQLVLARSVEVDGARASSHSALGYALLLDGDALSAATQYQLALEADPTFVKARANLAALKCRFGDREGARAELSLLKGASPSGLDVDPEWSTCH